MSQLAKEDWDAALEPATVAAVERAARIVAKKYGDRAVNMLAEYDDLRQEGLILVATKDRLRGLEPSLLTFRLAQELNGQVKYGAPKAAATTYLSSLDRNKECP